MTRAIITPVIAALALLAAIAAPFFISTFTLTIATNAIVFSIFAVSLNLILGHGGLPSLGHAAFFGTGAYAVGLLAQGGIHDFTLAVVTAIVASALFGLMLGPILLRTRETYFLMATLAVGEVMRNLAISWRSVTNGDDGLYGIKLPGYLADGRHFYFFVLAALVVVVAVMAIMMRAPFGHALRAVRDNRRRASVLGISPLTMEMFAFVISAAIAGFAGAMFAFSKRFVSPGVLSVETSADVLLMVVLGGPATLLGPVAGAFIVEAIRGIGSTYTQRWLTILGLLAVFVALDPRRFFRWLRAKAPPAPSSADTVSPTPTAKQPEMRTARQRPPMSISRSAAVPAISATGVAKHFGGLSVLNDISLTVAEGERRGLIGPNGAGKTTFLNILSGITQPNSGRIHFGSRDITSLPAYERAKLGLGRTFQIGNLFDECTVRENIVLGLLARDGYSLRFGRSLGRYDGLQDEASKLLDEWGLRDREAVPVKLLSYGQRRLIEIALAVSQRPKVLLLDEPAAGLSGNDIKMIIQTITSLDPKLSLLIVEHDMDLVFSVCDSVTVIAGGRVLAEGTGDQVRRDKAVVEAYLGMPL